MFRKSHVQIRTLWTCLIAFSTMFALAACEEKVTVTAQHDPLYRDVAHSSTISVVAKNSRSGISSIVIEVTRGEMTDCSELGEGPSLIPCRITANEMPFEYPCYFTDSPTSAPCDYTFSLGDGEIVTYRAVANSPSGLSGESQSITYSGGVPPALDIVRPILWHMGDPGGLIFKNRINLGFFPDTDYDNVYTDFTKDLELIIKGVFFNPSQNVSKEWTSHRFLFNLWAAPPGAQILGNCYIDYDSVAPILGALNGVAVIHRIESRDCASASVGDGEGTVWGRSVHLESNNSDLILIHEGSHFLLGLGDEYCCDGGYVSYSSPRNIFASELECSDAATALGLGDDTDKCKQIATDDEATGIWRIDQGRRETMGETKGSSKYRNSSKKAFANKMADCLDGSCY